MRKKIVFFGILSTAILLLQCGKAVGIVGNVGQYLISDDQEVQMGLNFSKEIASDTVQFPLYTNKPNYSTALVRHIDSIGQALVAGQTDRTGIEFHFTIINNDTTVNAFATPGGYVYIYTGLIKNATYDSEIAGVLAHEIGHITKRHGVKMLAAQNTTNFILKLVVGDSSLVRNVIDMANGLNFLAYSRDNEYEADSLAVEYVTAAGLNPTGVKTFMEYLATLGSVMFEPLASHPETSKRVAAIDQIIARKGSTVTSRPNPPKPYSP